MAQQVMAICVGGEKGLIHIFNDGGYLSLIN